MTGVRQSEEILYGTTAPRDSFATVEAGDKISAMLPDRVDPVALDLDMYHYLHHDDAVWIGAGASWLARGGHIPEDWMDRIPTLRNSDHLRDLQITYLKALDEQLIKIGGSLFSEVISRSFILVDAYQLHGHPDHLYFTSDSPLDGKNYEYCADVNQIKAVEELLGNRIDDRRFIEFTEGEEDYSELIFIDGHGRLCGTIALDKSF